LDQHNEPHVSFEELRAGLLAWPIKQEGFWSAPSAEQN